MTLPFVILNAVKDPFNDCRIRIEMIGFLLAPARLYRVGLTFNKPRKRIRAVAVRFLIYIRNEIALCHTERSEVSRQYL